MDSVFHPMRGRVKYEPPQDDHLVMNSMAIHETKKKAKWPSICSALSLPVQRYWQKEGAESVQNHAIILSMIKDLILSVLKDLGKSEGGTSRRAEPDINSDEVTVNETKGQKGDRLSGRIDTTVATHNHQCHNNKESEWGVVELALSCLQKCQGT